MTSKKSLKEWRNVIEREDYYVDINPYSHNIISLALGAINEKFGKRAANNAIKYYRLEKKGWKQVR